MKTIKLQPREYAKLATGKELAEVPEYVKKDQLRRRKGSSAWYWRKRIQKDQAAKFFTGSEDLEESHRLINRDYHLLAVGEKLKAKKTESPLLSDVALAYASAEISYIEATAPTRRNNLQALKTVTRHLAKGAEPRFKKIKGDDVKIEIADVGFWNKIRLNQLDKNAALKFLADYVKGYKPQSKEYQKRARGANDYLRQARGLFRKEAVEMYCDLFKFPDIDGFMNAKNLKAQKESWTAPDTKDLKKLWDDLPQLEENDPDAYSMFLMSYGAGLSRGESLNAMKSWLGCEEVVDIDGSTDTHYFIHVQATKDWRPKNEKRIRKAGISKAIFDKLRELINVPRSQRADKIKRINLTDEELAKAVWTKSVVKVAADLGVSDVCVAKTCSRRGIPRPPMGFWAKVDAGVLEHPKGVCPDFVGGNKVIQFTQESDSYIIKSGRNTSSKTGVGSRLAKWFSDHGWKRAQVSHEMRKLHLSRYLLETGDMYATSRQAGHGSYKTTERFYIGTLRRHKVNIELPA